MKLIPDQQARQALPLYNYFVDTAHDTVVATRRGSGETVMRITDFGELGDPVLSFSNLEISLADLELLLDNWNELVRLRSLKKA